MPQLDVLRGLAVLLVVFYHGFYDTQRSQPGHIANAFTQFTAGGWLGVNLFFILSGFLITGNLLDSRNKPRYYSKFYIRRALRILPALGLILLFLGLLHEISAGGILLSLGFLANYQMLLPGSTFYGPLWSLSVEEQFYLVWPVFVFLVDGSWLLKIAAALCVLEPLLRWLAFRQHVDPDLIHRATFLIADNLSLGALVAVFARAPFGTRKNAIRLATLGLIVSAVLLVCGLPLGLLHRTNPVGAAFQEVPFNFLFTAMLLLTLSLGSAFYASPWCAPLRWIGNISYGLYLVHPLIFTRFDKASSLSGSYYGHFGLQMFRFVLCFSISLALAWLSRQFYEERFLRLKGKLAA